MPVCGFLLSTLGWESTFYVTGVVGLAWSLLWFMLIFDSPAQHPRISVEERRFIEHALGSSVQAQGKEVSRGRGGGLEQPRAPRAWGIVPVPAAHANGRQRSTCGCCTASEAVPKPVCIRDPRNDIQIFCDPRLYES